jgi:hypothetical protein
MVDATYDNLTVNNQVQLINNQNAILYRNSNGTLKWLGGLRSDVAGNTDDFVFYSYQNNSWIRLDAGAKGFLINGDTNLYRSVADILKTDDTFVAMLGLYVNDQYYAGINNNGVLLFGNKSSAWDTNLYRAGANELKTDDNFTVASALKLPCTCPVPTWAQLEPCLWGLQWNSGTNQWDWTADSHELALGSSFLRFNDNATNKYLDIGIIRTAMNPEDCALWISRHLMVKKDFCCGGAASVFQGALILGSDWDAHDTNGQMPQIYLAHSEGSPYPENPKRDTLQIWRAGHVGFANVQANVIQGASGGSGAAFKIGDDCYLVDINYANRIGIQGVQDSSQGGFRMGNNGPWLYRDGGYLRTDSGFIADGTISVGSVLNLGWGSGTRGPLYVYGNSSSYGGTICVNASSQRYKENIETLSDCSWIYNLRPVNFDWKDKERQKAEGTQLGLIAEEVDALCPQLTWRDSEGKPEGVHYEWLGVPLLVEVKKLRKRVEALENQLKSQTVA